MGDPALVCDVGAVPGSRAVRRVTPRMRPVLRRIRRWEKGVGTTVSAQLIASCAMSVSSAAAESGGTGRSASAS